MEVLIGLNIITSLGCLVFIYEVSRLKKRLDRKSEELENIQNRLEIVHVRGGDSYWLNRINDKLDSINNRLQNLELVEKYAKTFNLKIGSFYTNGVDFKSADKAELYKYVDYESMQLGIDSYLKGLQACKKGKK